MILARSKVDLMSDDWTPDSWRTKRAAQGVEYADDALLRHVLSELADRPPLVAVSEIEALRRQLADAQAGRLFVLQGGDCCERFDDCRPETIAGKLDILRQMSRIIAAGLRRQVVCIGRIAGQFAKPRSAEIETRDGVTLPSYRGDLINLSAFTAEARVPDPRRLLLGHKHAMQSLHCIRGLIGGDAPREIDDDGQPIRDRIEFFTSHEGLHLDYERAQTRFDPATGAWYDMAAHFLWIGHRTSTIDGAHVEFFRGIGNPIGLKVGPSMTPDELIALADLLSPDGILGRLTLIHRFGAGQIESCLPRLIEAVQRRGKPILWCCDPMHGNTQATRNGLKTRDFNQVLSELRQAFDIHAGMGSVLGGVHFELTGEDVAECIGGPGGPSEADLGKAYFSDIDPRLNRWQALEMAGSIARRTHNQ